MDFLSFLEQYGSVIFAAVQCMLSLAIYGKFSRKFLSQFLQEVDMLYHKKLDDAQASINNVAQTFSTKQPSYVLNDSTGELERLPIDEDIQERIESYLTSALDRVLERYLPQDVSSENDEVADYTAATADLADLGEMYEKAESYREKYHLGNDMSIREIYDFIGERAKDLANKISERSKVSENSQTTESEG